MNQIKKQTKLISLKKNSSSELDLKRKELKSNLDEKAKIKIWLRTLLYSYRIIPRIINAIDKVIYARASNYSFSANVFNASKKLENQIDIVIDMSERKQKLLNIYVMTKKLLSFLPDDYFVFADKKFYDQMTNDEIAEELGVSVRTVFRKANEILEYLYNYVIRNHWSLKFIELQVKDEDWLLERYNYYIDEYLTDCIKKSHS